MFEHVLGPSWGYLGPSWGDRTGLWPLGSSWRYINLTRTLRAYAKPTRSLRGAYVTARFGPWCQELVTSPLCWDPWSYRFVNVTARSWEPR
eukprot:4978635-Pyramimonas_sp.AAC.1